MYSVIERLEEAKGMLSVKQVAEILGVNVGTVYKLANDKELPAIRVAAKWVFDPKTLSVWVRRQNPTFAKHS